MARRRSARRARGGAGRGRRLARGARRLLVGRHPARPRRPRTCRRRPAVTDAEAFERCIRVGGLVLFGADTVYGLACDPDDRFAVERLYLLKRRTLDKPSAVMFFALERAFEAVPEIGERTRGAMARLLPGGRDRARCRTRRGGLRSRAGPMSGRSDCGCPCFPRWPAVRRPVLQSSANRAGGADPRSLDEVPALLRAAVDLVIDAGELPGTPSTVVDLRRYEVDGEWQRRAGGGGGRARADRGAPLAVPLRRCESMRTRSGRTCRHTTRSRRSWPARADRARVGSSSSGPGPARRPAGCSRATRMRSLVGIDENERMLAVAAGALPGARACRLRAGRIEDALPAGPFDLVASALCVHHLYGGGEGRPVLPGARRARAGWAVRDGRRGRPDRPGVARRRR